MIEHSSAAPLLSRHEVLSAASWTVIEHDGRRSIAVAGELDMATAPTLSIELLSYAIRAEGDVVVDCSSMTFIDSSGIKALISVHHALAPFARKLVLTNVSEACRRPLEITGLIELFGIAPERRSAR